VVRGRVAVVAAPLFVVALASAVLADGGLVVARLAPLAPRHQRFHVEAHRVGGLEQEVLVERLGQHPLFRGVRAELLWHGLAVSTGERQSSAGSPGGDTGAPITGLSPCGPLARSHAGSVATGWVAGTCTASDVIQNTLI